MFNIKNQIFLFFLVSGILHSADLENFAKDWVGYESLSSPSLDYQNSQIYLNVRADENESGRLVYVSNSEFIYNSYLDWAVHYFTYNKDLNNISFGRLFYTPLGIIGTKEIIYKILESNENRITIEHISLDSLTVHKISLSATSLSSFKDPSPKSVQINSNYPNPFNLNTTIPIKVSTNDYMHINIFNSNGKLVKKLFNGELLIGQYNFRWNGLDEFNKMVGSGIYFL